MMNKTLMQFAGPPLAMMAMTITPLGMYGQEPDATLTQTEIARLVLSPRSEDVGRGISQMGWPRNGSRMSGIQPEEWSPELRAAIVQAVEQKAWLDYPEYWEGELQNEVYDAAWAIAELGDPIAIRAIAAFGYTGYSVYEWLALQGEPALWEVIRTVKDPTGKRHRNTNQYARWKSARRAAFKTMAMYADERGPQGIEAELLSEFRRLALAALDDPDIVEEAIGLSVLLGDAELTGRVERLATDPAATTDVRELARSKLEDPIPSWNNLAWWRKSRLKRCVEDGDSQSRVCRRLLTPPP